MRHALLVVGVNWLLLKSVMCDVDFVAGRLLSEVVSCFMFVVCCLLFVACCLLLDVCCASCVIVVVLFAGCALLFVSMFCHV